MLKIYVCSLMWVEIFLLLQGKSPWSNQLLDPKQDLHLPYKHFATGLASHDRLSNDIQEFICHSWQ